MCKQAAGETAAAERLEALQTFTVSVAVVCPRLDAKLVIAASLHEALQTARDDAKAPSVNTGADPQTPIEPGADVTEVCRAANPERADQLAELLDALAEQLSSTDGASAPALVSGSTARLAAFCKLLAQHSAEDEAAPREAMSEEARLKAWARAHDKLVTMSLPDSVAGLRWLLHGLQCPVPIAESAADQGAVCPSAATLSSAARGIVVRDAVSALSNALATEAPADEEALAAGAALLQDLRVEVLTADAIAGVRAQCELPEAASGLVEAALEVAAEGRDGLEPALPDCLQVRLHTSSSYLLPSAISAGQAASSLWSGHDGNSR